MRPSTLMGAVCAGVLALAIGAVLSTSPPGVPRGGTLLFDGPPASSLIPPPALAPQALRRPTAEPIALVERGAATHESRGVASTSTDVGILGAGVVGRVVPVAPIMDTPIAPGHDAVPTTDPPKPTTTTTTTTPTTPTGGGTGGVTTGTDPPQPHPPVAPTPEPKGPVTKVIDDLGDVTGGVTGTVTGVTSTGHAAPASPTTEPAVSYPTATSTSSTVATPIVTTSVDPNLSTTSLSEESVTAVVTSAETLVSDAVQLIATNPDGGLLG